MAYALETRTEKRPAEAAEGFALSDLWMLPLLVLALIFDKFRRHLARLKDMRRSRPMPKDWQSFYPELRQSEWAMHRLCFEGARQIVLGQDLDLSALSYDPEPPEAFQPSMPRSALAMHRRMEDIARFHADPERYIRRHAMRIAARTSFAHPDPNPPNPPNPANLLSGPNPDPANFPCPIPTTTIFSIAIRGPPVGWISAAQSTIPDLAATRLQERDAMPDAENFLTPPSTASSSGKARKRRIPGISVGPFRGLYDQSLRRSNRDPRDALRSRMTR